jgi:hypothetical protein
MSARKAGTCTICRNGSAHYFSSCPYVLRARELRNAEIASLEVACAEAGVDAEIADAWLADCAESVLALTTSTPAALTAPHDVDAEAAGAWLADCTESWLAAPHDVD